MFKNLFHSTQYSPHLPLCTPTGTPASPDHVLVPKLQVQWSLVVGDRLPVVAELDIFNWHASFLRERLLHIVDVHRWLHFECHFIRHNSLYLQGDAFLFTVTTTSLLLVHFYYIILFHFKSFRSFVIVNSSSVKKEPERGDRHPNSLRVRLFELAHLRGPLHPEVNLIGILSNNFQFDVLRLVTHLIFKA